MVTLAATELRSIIAQARLELAIAKFNHPEIRDKVAMLEWALHQPEFANGLIQSRQEGLQELDYEI